MSPVSFTLNTGAKIPAVGKYDSIFYIYPSLGRGGKHAGFGGWGGNTAEKREVWKSALISALKAGYRHIDGAWLYQTEEIIGAAVRECGIPREDIFVTTKLPSHHGGRVQEFFDDSLNRLGLDYVDLVRSNLN